MIHKTQKNVINQGKLTMKKKKSKPLKKSLNDIINKNNVICV